jgi:diguanylate cyclase
LESNELDVIDQRESAAAGRLEDELGGAIQGGQLVLAYQPIFRLDTGALIGLEALVRWRHPRRGLMRPARFVPIAEATGQILELGRWVLQTAASQAAVWRERQPELNMSINISSVQLRKPGLLEHVNEALDAADLDPGALTLEITESVLIENTATAARHLEELKELGVDLAIDDFGTGYSSLAHLERFPLDDLKIDRAFVAAINRPERGASMLRAIVSLADAFELTPVAEGIERPEQVEHLLALGCDVGQGHLLSRPLLTPDVDELLRGLN